MFDSAWSFALLILHRHLILWNPYFSSSNQVDFSTKAEKDILADCRSGTGYYTKRGQAKKTSASKDAVGEGDRVRVKKPIDWREVGECLKAWYGVDSVWCCLCAHSNAH